MLNWFFNQVAELDATLYPQDRAGGEVPTPQVLAILVPCCVQQDSGPRETDGQRRRGSEAGLRIFFQPCTPQALAIVRALKVNDRVIVQGRPVPLLLDGPAFDAAGRGVVWEASAREVL